MDLQMRGGWMWELEGSGWLQAVCCCWCYVEVLEEEYGRVHFLNELVLKEICRFGVSKLRGLRQLDARSRTN